MDPEAGQLEGVSEVPSHARVWHTHSGVRMLANTVSIRKREQYKLGVFCLYCEFQPNDNARALHQTTLEQILAKRGKIRQARRSN